MIDPKKTTPNQEVDRDFLGPGEAVVEHVAGEELDEDRKCHGPEHELGNPILDRVAGKIDRLHLLFEGVGDFLGGGGGGRWRVLRHGLTFLIEGAGLGDVFARVVRIYQEIPGSSPGISW